MKLLVLSHVSDYIGGAEKSLIDVLDSWRAIDAELNIRFIVRKPLGGIEAELDKRRIPYHSIDYTYWSDSNLPDTPDRIYGNALRNMRAVECIEDIIADWQPDVVLTNSIIAPWAALAAHFKGVPHAWMVREYGNKDHGRTFEIGEHDTFEDIGNLSELVYTNSVTLREYITQYIDDAKLTTIYTPFVIGKLQEKAKEDVEVPIKFSEKSLKLLLVGNVAPGKGHELAIKAIGSLKSSGIQAEVCFVGREGTQEYMRHLYNLADTLGVRDKLHFAGFQPNPLAYAKYVDVALMTSRMEAFGRVTFEYAVASLPVVGSNSGATPEIVIDGKTGFLYMPGDEHDLAEKLAKYAGNSKLIVQHGREALRHAEAMMDSNYSAERAYSKLRELIGVPKTKFARLNYAHRWTRYPQDAQEYMKFINGASLKEILKIKAKTALRPSYVYAKNALQKVRRK